MTDRLMKLYELNEQYHDTKEKMAWLATTFYAGFSLVVIRVATNKGALVFLKVQQPSQIPILVLTVGLLLVIFLCVRCFNAFQYRKKRASVDIEGYLAKELSVQNGDESIQLASVFKYKQIAHEKKLCWKQKKNLSPTEIPILVLMSALFSAQVLVILITSGLLK